MSHVRRNVIASLVLWAVVTLVYAGHLLVHYLMGDFACETPVGSSNYGHAVWQWWPPGTACEYTTAHLPSYVLVEAHTDRPSVAAATIAIVLVAWPAATLIFARLIRGRKHRGQHEAEPETASQ